MTAPDPNRGSPDAVLLVVAWVCHVAPRVARVVGVGIVVLLLIGSAVLLYR